jgi:hypothetical protein
MQRPAQRYGMALGAALTLAACAGTPQLTQGEQRSGPPALTKPFESGTVAGNVYIPSAAEKALECKKLKGSMLIIIARLKDSSARPKASAASAAIQSGVSSVKGQANTMDLDAELQRERARLTAYNGLLAEKKCSPMDLTKELATPR